MKFYLKKTVVNIVVCVLEQHVERRLYRREYNMKTSSDTTRSLSQP